MKKQLVEVAKEMGERVLITPHNPISLGVTLNGLRNSDGVQENSNIKDITFFGSMLWSR